MRRSKKGSTGKSWSCDLGRIGVFALSFLHPELFIAGLVAVGLPILVHLLTRRRRKTVRWGAMRFLMEAYRRQRRRLRLEQFLLLLVRCVLVVLIGLGLARPMFGADGAGGRGSRTVVLVIDNSLASSAIDGAGESDLERSKALALRLIGSLDAMGGDRVGLVTLGGPAAGVVMQPSADVSSVSRAVEGVRATDSMVDLAGGGAVLEGHLGDDTEVIVLSGWRSGSVPTGQMGSSWDGVTRLIVSLPGTVELSNVGISSLEPPRSLLVTGGLGPADLATPARVRLVRSGEDVSRAGVTRISAWLDPVGGGSDSIEVGQSIVRWTAGQTEALATVRIRPESVVSSQSFGVLRVTIEADSVAGDNVRRSPIEMREQLRVGLVAPGRFGQAVGVDRFGPRDWVRLALTPSDDGERGLSLVEIEPGALDRPRVAGLDAAIVIRPDLVRVDGWSVLRGLADRGGLVMVTPAAGEAVQGWTDAFEEAFGVGWTIGREATELANGPALAEPGLESGSLLGVLGGELSFLVEAVHVSRVLKMDGVKDAEVALRVSTGEPMLAATRTENGRGVVGVMASAIDVEWTDLPVKPLMVPLMQELVRQGVAQGSSGTTLVAGGLYDGGGVVRALSPIGVGRSMRVGEGGVAIWDEGAWRSVDGSGAMVGVVAVNADERGGGVDTRTTGQVEAMFAGLGIGEMAVLDAAGVVSGEGLSAAGDAAQREGWAWMVLLCAGAFALIEMFVARGVSHAGRMFGVGAGLGRAA